MKKYYCNGKKGFCDKPNINMCSFCEFTNGEGGKEVEIPNTNYERIRNMSVEEMAEFMTHIKNGWITEIGKEICREKHLKWLESEVTEE